MEEIRERYEEIGGSSPGKDSSHVAAYGGDIELVEVNDGVVKVRLTGACKGCPMSQMTLKQGVEKLLLKEVPGLKEVQAV